MITAEPTYRIFLLPCELSGSLEIDSQIREVTFVVLADVLDGVNVERHGITMDGKDDCLGFPVDINLQA